jgi:hypothetical protein
LLSEGIAAKSHRRPAPMLPRHMQLKAAKVLAGGRLQRDLEEEPQRGNGGVYGRRASEVVALKVSDIDSERMTLRIEQGKGRKYRIERLVRWASGIHPFAIIRFTASSRRGRQRRRGRAVRPISPSARCR